MKVCPLPSHCGYHLSSDRKRVFGCEFLELAELNKALRESSASLSGVTTRFRSKPRSLRTPKSTWVAPDLQVSCNFFRGPRRRFPCQECVLICFSRLTESSIVVSILQRTHHCARLLGSRCLIGMRVPGPGVCTEADTRGILSGKWQPCLAWFHLVALR